MIGASKATSTREYQVLSTTTITSVGNQQYTVPAGVVFIEIEMYGAGGGGGAGFISSGRGGTVHMSGGGGGGGAYVRHRLRIADLRENDELDFVVGAGGARSTSHTSAASAGGQTQLSKHQRDDVTITAFSNIKAGGGGGGASALQVGDGGSAGVAQNGNITNTNGSVGGVRNTGSGVQSGGAGGDAGGPDGGDGGAGSTNSGTSSPTAPGGGGGAGTSKTNTNGVVGANGKVIVKAFG